MQSDKIDILLIDDEKLIVDMLTSFLSKKGFAVTGLTDSRVALEYIENITYDLVLTDLKMPDISGMDIVKAVKATGKDTQIIIFTGYATIDSAIEAIRQGVYDYIKKPFRLEEILFAINRAVENLILKRQNIAYQRRIEKMLSDITMLVDISSILYQIPDFNMAIDMILDTLTEGMKIKKAGIFLPGQSNDLFTIRQSKGLSETLVKEFSFSPGDNINNIIVSSSEPVILSDIEEGLYISNLEIKTDDDLTCCNLIPIKYLESLLGYIGIFQMSEDISLFEDEIKLLKVLATQVAPIFQALETENQDTENEELPFDRIIFNAVKERYLIARQLHSSVSFVLLKLKKEQYFLNLSTGQYTASTFSEMVIKEFNSFAEVVTLESDFVLVIIPSGNPVNIELSCLNIQMKVEELYGIETEISCPTLKYAIVNYPVDGSSVSEIINGLWLRLFHEFERDEDCTGNSQI